MSEPMLHSDQSVQNPYPIDLKELLVILWAAKWLISAVTGLSAAISIVFALSLPNIYTASALLAPAESSGSGLSGLMKQYGGLASLAGVSLPGGESGSRAQLGMQLMKSRSFISRFVERRDILPELMAIEAWDAESGSVIFDPDLYDAGVKKWVREVRFPKTSKPSAQEANKAFATVLTVSEDKQSGYVTVSIDHRSPIIAAQWVNWLIEDVNSAVRAQDVAEAEKSIEYLKQQVANTSLADLQAMFFELIQSQTETMMLAQVRPEYVFKTIDPAVVPEEKSKPSRAFICVVGTLLGVLLAVITTLIRHFVKRESDR